MFVIQRRAGGGKADLSIPIKEEEKKNKKKKKGAKKRPEKVKQKEDQKNKEPSPVEKKMRKREKKKSPIKTGWMLRSGRLFSTFRDRKVHDRSRRRERLYTARVLARLNQAQSRSLENKNMSSLGGLDYLCGRRIEVRCVHPSQS